MTEEALIKLAASGDRKAFELLVSAHQHRVIACGARILNDPSLAEDIAQETFLRLWRSLRNGRFTGSLAAFLLTTVRNLAVDQLRYSRTRISAQAVEGRAAPEAYDPENNAQRKALQDAVAAALSTLPEPQRTVFMLSHYEGLSYQQIAEIVGCPIGTVASRKRLAVETLRRRLLPWVQEDQ